MTSQVIRANLATGFPVCRLNVYDVRDVTETSADSNTNSRPNSSTSSSRLQPTGDGGISQADNTSTSGSGTIQFEYRQIGQSNISNGQNQQLDVFIPRSRLKASLFVEIVFPSNMNQFWVSMDPLGPFDIGLSNYPERVRLHSSNSIKSTSADFSSIDFLANIESDENDPIVGDYSIAVRDRYTATTINELSVGFL